ncbi:MAG TPA: small basic protein [Planctomycetota bacterium]|nr:small basic protein [Planctomycetota bacterium]
MTVHKSLKAGGMVKHRNVLTRTERMLKLEKDERWTNGASVLGLPKTKVPPQVGKKKKKAATPAEGGAAGAPAGGAVPTAGGTSGGTAGGAAKPAAGGAAKPAAAAGAAKPAAKK